MAAEVTSGLGLLFMLRATSRAGWRLLRAHAKGERKDLARICAVSVKVLAANFVVSVIVTDPSEAN